MAASWDVDIAQLEARGYFILRGFVPPETCAAARAFVDGVIGAPSPVEQIETEGRGQPTGATVQQPQGFTSTNWPDPSSELPYLTSGNYRHGILPPVCGPFSCELHAGAVLPALPHAVPRAGRCGAAQAHEPHVLPHRPLPARRRRPGHAARGLAHVRPATRPTTTRPPLTPSV